MVSYEDRLVGNTGDVIESEGSLECCLPAQKGPPPFLLFREAPSQIPFDQNWIWKAHVLALGRLFMARV
jgi:hypothetical protein